MVSPEVLRRYSFFAGLTYDHLVWIARIADEITVEAGEYFFRERDELTSIYVVLEGQVAILFDVPAQDGEHKIADQFTRDLKTQEVVICTVSGGDVFGWSALVPPFKATATARAQSASTVIAIDSKRLLDRFEDDYRFGYLMVQKAAQISRDRLHDTRIETLSDRLQ